MVTASVTPTGPQTCICEVWGLIYFRIEKFRGFRRVTQIFGEKRCTLHPAAHGGLRSTSAWCSHQGRHGFQTYRLGPVQVSGASTRVTRKLGFQKTPDVRIRHESSGAYSNLSTRNPAVFLFHSVSLWRKTKNEGQSLSWKKKILES